MLFNNARCRVLTPDYVNTASGLDLHQFKWLGNDDLIERRIELLDAFGRLRQCAANAGRHGDCACDAGHFQNMPAGKSI